MRILHASCVLASMLPFPAIAVTIIDGSFEDPQIFPAGSTVNLPQPFTFWDISGVGNIGIGRVSAFVGVLPDTLDGTDQWAYMRNDLGASQRIATGTDDTGYVIEFAQGGQGTAAEPGRQEPPRSFGW